MIKSTYYRGLFIIAKKKVYRVKLFNENKKNIISALIEEYNIKIAYDIQEALANLLGGTIKSIME